MSTYKDIDAILSRLPDDLPYKASVKRVLIQAPTADVVPRSEYDEVVYKLECLLCHATGSRLSKSTYTLKTMETAVTDYIQECYDEAQTEATKEVAREIVDEFMSAMRAKHEENRPKWGGALALLLPDIEQIATDLKKKYTEVE